MIRRIVTGVLLGTLAGGFALALSLPSSSPPEPRTVQIPVDGYRITGYVSEARQESDQWIVLVHGNRREGQGHPLYAALQAGLSREVNVLAIDMWGFGRSSARAEATASSAFDRYPDIRAAIGYLNEEYGASEDQISLVGHSLGALQVLRAANAASVRSVIALGPADFSVFIAERESREAYRTKYEQRTGVRMTDAVFIDEASRFIPSALFGPCPDVPIVLIFGQRDISEGLNQHREAIPKACREQMKWKTIPLADHMYFTEEARLPGVLARAMSRGAVELLVRNILHFVGSPTG